jgi:hypothetical protein
LPTRFMVKTYWAMGMIFSGNLRVQTLDYRGDA